MFPWQHSIVIVHPLINAFNFFCLLFLFFFFFIITALLLFRSLGVYPFYLDLHLCLLCLPPPSPAALSLSLSISLSLFFHRSPLFLLLLPFTHLYSLHYKAKRIWWLACTLCPQTQLTPRIFSLCWIVPQNERQLKEPTLRWHLFANGGSVGPRSQVEHRGNCLFLTWRSTCWHSWAKIDVHAASNQKRIT